jgi:Fur family transcriptional regulator, ferric uptake regulator
MQLPVSPTLSAQWLSVLQDSGYRLTAPRRVIVEIMASCERALSPVDLFDLGRKDQPGLGLVTVYRTLEKMEELGLVQRVHQPNGCHRYLPAARGHQHLLLCENCGKAVLFDGDELTTLFQSVTKSTGFVIKEHWLQLFGLCANCQ